MLLKKLVSLVLLASALVWADSNISNSLSTEIPLGANSQEFICKTEPALDSDNDNASAPCAYSSLWGIAGEKWKPEERLPDFSYAGYHAGEARIPTPQARWNLKRDFHARGDGQTDDSQALQTAIQTIKSGVLFIPKGTYVISKRIDVSKGNLILRGEGPGETVLFFPNSLTDLFGNTINGAGQSQWSFRPGLINFTGRDAINTETRLASVNATANAVSAS